MSVSLAIDQLLLPSTFCVIKLDLRFKTSPMMTMILLGVEPQYRVFSVVRSRNNHTYSRTPTPVQVASFKANYLRLVMRLVAGQ